GPPRSPLLPSTTLFRSPGIAAEEFEEAGHQSAYNAGAQHEESSVPASKTEPAVARPPLVSEETSRQVAAAFGELSEAFASRSRKDRKSTRLNSSHVKIS